MSRRTLINLVFFLALFFVMIYWALGNVVHLRAYENPYRIQGEFEAAVGVRANAEVAFLGVNYGSVSSVERMPGGVRVTMHIDKGKKIPKGSIAPSSASRRSASRTSTSCRPTATTRRRPTPTIHRQGRRDRR